MIRVVEYYCSDHLISLFRRSSCRSFSSFHYSPHLPRCSSSRHSYFTRTIFQTILYSLYIDISRRDYAFFFFFSISSFNFTLNRSCHRVIVPSRFRKEGGGGLFVTRTNPKSSSLNSSFNDPSTMILTSVRIFPRGGKDRDPRRAKRSYCEGGRREEEFSKRFGGGVVNSKRQRPAKG